MIWEHLFTVALCIGPTYNWPQHWVTLLPTPKVKVKARPFNQVLTRCILLP